MMADVPGSAAVPTEDNLLDVLRQYMEVTERLQQTHQVLQGEVERLRAELASKDRELELRRRLAALGELAAGVAHEVRNPLGAIQLYSGLLRNQCHAHKLMPALQLIEKIEAGIHAIEAVVQDTLALAPRDRQLAVCPLEDIVRRVQDATLKTLNVCQVQLAVDCAADLSVRADPVGLQRVLVNLVVNAAEASPAGRRIWLDVRSAEGGQVELRVRDEGPGLPVEIQHRVFDPFFTTKQDGTGLGLTIAHRLVEAYGGQLRARNREEGGAEFVLTLPRVDTDADPSAEGMDAGERGFSAA